MKYPTLNTIGLNSKMEKIEMDTKSIYLKINAPYVVDDSKFCPVKNALENLKGQVLSDEQIAQSYDFSDGQDNGAELPITRGRFADITEVSAEINKTSNNLKESFDDFKESEERKAKQKARLDMLNATKQAATSTAAKE